MLKPFLALYRRLFAPELPWWVPMALCSDRFIAALSGCSIEEAAARNAFMLELHHQRWLAGEKF